MTVATSGATIPGAFCGDAPATALCDAALHGMYIVNKHRWAMQRLLLLFASQQMTGGIASCQQYGYTISMIAPIRTNQAALTAQRRILVDRFAYRQPSEGGVAPCQIVAVWTSTFQATGFGDETWQTNEMRAGDALRWREDTPVSTKRSDARSS